MMRNILLASTFVGAIAKFNIYENDLSVVPADYKPEHPLCDNSTYGNVEEIATSHYHIDWQVDFDTSLISGSVVHDLISMVDNVKYL